MRRRDSSSSGLAGDVVDPVERDLRAVDVASSYDWHWDLLEHL